MSDAPPTYTLHRHPEPQAVVRLPVGTDVPDWVASGTLMSVTATSGETSIVCAAASVPRKSRHEGPFIAFEVAGRLDFALSGVLADLLAPLAEPGISVFVISTFDTDWVLVREGRADDAAAAWHRQGHTVRGAVTTATEDS